MGLGTLVLRGLTVITPAWANDIRAALIGDFVGRDATGAPVAGNNLGNPLFPWGTVFANSVVTSSGSIDPSQLETQPYKIVSGKTRSGSTQPDFIRASGSGANFTVQATSTPLELQIAGTLASWIADRTQAGTLAPSSNNTATLNDGAATGQAATRTWGEYGSNPSLGGGSPFYSITISSVGSNITSKVGSWQVFKVHSEYFLAFVESTVSLSRCFRGFFLDSTGAPVKRAALTNGDTITLMSLGWVFCDADGTTVDTTYNNPTFSFATPTSPSTGDYWFDQANQLWKRYNGSSFILVNRTLVGLVVLDSTNCVATRSLDFFKLTRSDNTIELFFVSSTVIKAQGLLERINVNGNRIRFDTSRAIWDTASNLAASSERYNAAVTASTTEYFYVTDKGETKISDMEPFWRPDLLGHYHPFNPWRYVGQNTTDGSANFQASTMAMFNRNALTLNRLSLGLTGISDLNCPSLLAVTPNTVSVEGAFGATRYAIMVSANPSTEGLKVIRGLVTGSTGAAVSGEGFSCSRIGTGSYTITFSPPFLDIPSVVPGACAGLGSAANPTSITASGFTMSTGVLSAGSFVVADLVRFSFQAIGQRA